ncbi:MAG TPA: cytochrome c oxidase subunit II [Solirubrobacteraceae bacterium]|jgi:cytochrome c oxidase subunit 2|nr:cytochrome c oxidase subunit II [Solirubrobacteraceae bacterium]
MAQPNHFRRFMAIWLLSSAVITPVSIILLAPVIPPGNASVQAAGHVTDNEVLLAMSIPVLLLVVIYLVYAAMYFRESSGAVSEGPAIRGDSRVQIAWIVITTALVLGLAGYGSAELINDGAGSGQGPNPAFPAAGKPLKVQVIAQQWMFTYRYPSYGGIETPHLVIPDNQLVQFNVTSIDVIHSFWAYQLGVKADANPQQNNIAYVTPTKLGSFSIRCAELCGIWHGYMYDTGRVVTASAFQSWINSQQKKFAPIAKELPPYATTYLPTPSGRGT